MQFKLTSLPNKYLGLLCKKNTECQTHTFILIQLGKISY